MVKVKFWIGVLSTPVLLASVGCSLGPRPNPTVQRGMTTDRLMSMARTFERQGHYPQAKNAYLQVMAVQPDYPNARKALDTLIALETQQLQQGRQAAGTQVAAATPGVVRPVQVAAAPAIASVPVIQSAPLPPQTIVAAPVTQLKELPVQQMPAVTENAPATTVEQPQQVARPAHAAAPAMTQEMEIPALPALSSAPTAPQGLLSTISEDLASNESLELTDIVEVPNSVIETEVETELSFGAEEQIATAEINDPEPVPELLTTIEPETVSTAPAPLAATAPQPIQLNVEVQLAAPITADSQSIAGTNSWQIQSLTAAPAMSTVTLQQIEQDELRPYFDASQSTSLEGLRHNRARLQPMLVSMIMDHTMGRDLRMRAVYLIGAMGPDASAALPALHHEMQTESDRYLAVAIAESALRIQPEDTVAIQWLVSGLKERDQNLRWVSAFALRNAVSPNATFVVSSLKALLATEDLKLKRMVFLTLAEFGPAAADVIPDLEAALNSPDAGIREVARAALASIAPGRKTAMSTPSQKQPIDLTAAHK